MRYTVIRDGKYTGINYTEINNEILAQYTSLNEYIMPVDEFPEPISFGNDGNPIYDSADINSLKRGKLQELANARWLEETAGYMYNGHEFHSDRESQDRVFQAYMASLSDPNFTVTWKTKTGWLDMTAKDFIALYNEFQTFLQDLYKKEKTLQEKVRTVTTIKELEALKW